MRRDALARDAGTSSLEFVALMPVLLLVVAGVWQILLIASVATAAENAARTGSRAQTLGRDGSAVALEALSPWMQDQARAVIGGSGACDGVDGQGTRVTVCVPVPVLWPGVFHPTLVVVRDAELPPPT